MLKQDYLDSIFLGNRKYKVINHEDGTISLEDLTVYEQPGDTFAAKDVNVITRVVNGHNVAPLHDITIPAADFVASADYAAYPFHADLSISDLLESDVCDVIPTPESQEMDVLGSYNESHAGQLRIYAKEKPKQNLVLATILIERKGL